MAEQNFEKIFQTFFAICICNSFKNQNHCSRFQYELSVFPNQLRAATVYYFQRILNKTQLGEIMWSYPRAGALVAFFLLHFLELFGDFVKAITISRHRWSVMTSRSLTTPRSYDRRCRETLTACCFKISWLENFKKTWRSIATPHVCMASQLFSTFLSAKFLLLGLPHWNFRILLLKTSAHSVITNVVKIMNAWHWETELFELKLSLSSANTVFCNFQVNNSKQMNKATQFLLLKMW